MKKLLAALFIVFLSACSCARAAGTGGTSQCSNFDSALNSTVALMPLLQLCTFTTGVTGRVQATWSGETQCTTGATQSMQMFIGPGAQPAITGQNFGGTAAGGVLSATTFFQNFLGGVIASGDYDPVSGLVILAENPAGSPPGGRGFSSGVSVTISGLSGTDAVLNGAQIATAGTGFPVVFFTVATGQSITVGAGGSMTDAGGHTASILSGIYNSTTGNVSLTSNGAGSFAPTSGTTVTVSGLTGSGAALNGSHTATTNTGKAAIAFTTTTGQSITVGAGGSAVSAPYIAQVGQTLTSQNLLGNDGITVTGLGTNTTGGLGTYTISYAGSATFSNGAYFLTIPPAGVTAITPVMQQAGCSAGEFVITELTGVFVGAPNTQYWLGIAFSMDANTHSMLWANGRATIFFY